MHNRSWSSTKINDSKKVVNGFQLELVKELKYLDVMLNDDYISKKMTRKYFLVKKIETT